MAYPDPQIPHAASTDSHRVLQTEVWRLHQLTVYGRWLFVSVLWLTLAPLSLWGWRYELSLLRSHFTWAALRYGIIYNRLPFLGLAFCTGMTLAVLVWQSRNILHGIPASEQRRLERQTRRIVEQGPSHPLWKWVCKP